MNIKDDTTLLDNVFKILNKMLSVLALANIANLWRGSSRD